MSTSSCSAESGTYDAFGRKAEWVENGTTIDYLYDPFGQRVGKYMAGAWSRDYVPLAGRNVAKYAGSETYFIHQNALGSTTFVTDHAGTVQQGQLLYPRGEPWQVLGSSLDGTFAGLFPLDQYGFFSTPNRHYTPSYGLWLSPDPVGGDITNPRSLNRYTYGVNNPTTLTDPSGLNPTNSDWARLCLQFGNCLRPCNQTVNSGCTGAPVGWDQFDLMNIRVYGGTTWVEGWEVGANQIGTGFVLFGGRLEWITWETQVNF